MKKIGAILFVSLMAGCGSVKGSKQYAEFDLEQMLRKVCAGEDCKLEEMSKGTAESADFTLKNYKYLITGESVSLSGVASLVMAEIETRIDQGVLSRKKFEGNLCMDYSLDYATGGRKGLLRAIFVKVAGGVLVMVDLRETN